MVSVGPQGTGVTTGRTGGRGQYSWGRMEALGTRVNPFEVDEPQFTYWSNREYDIHFAGLAQAQTKRWQEGASGMKAGKVLRSVRGSGMWARVLS